MISLFYLNLAQILYLISRKYLKKYPGNIYFSLFYYYNLFIYLASLNKLDLRIISEIPV